MGLLLKWKLHTKLVVEINGIYDDPDNLADIKSPFSTTVKLWFFNKISSLVINHSDGVKLLFSGQANSFLRGAKNPPVLRDFPNLVNTQPFIDAPADLSKKRILFTGFPYFRKGVDIIIEAFMLVSDEFPDWELTLLGYLDESLVQKGLKGTRNIKHLPAVPEEEMPGQMANHSIFVLPSRSEAMGRVLIEAMAAGCARIGSNQGGIPTVIDNGVDGMLFEKNNAHDLASCLRQLMGSEKLRKTYSDAARIRLTNEFTQTNFSKDTKKLYDDVIIGK